MSHSDETPIHSSAADRAERVADLTLELAGPDVEGEGYLGKLGRLNVAQGQAEEILRHEEHEAKRDTSNG